MLKEWKETRKFNKDYGIIQQILRCDFLIVQEIKSKKEILYKRFHSNDPISHTSESTV